jgi:hypothetical protein
MSIYVRTVLFASLVFLLLCYPFLKVRADSTEIPKHLALARELVDNIKPEDNRYSLGDQAISFPEDLFSSKYSTQYQMSFLVPSPARRRLVAEDFVFSIEKEAGFKRIRGVRDIKPGDLLAHAMLNIDDKRQTGTTGHVFLINSYPKQIKPRNPIVEGTEQFEVSIIDSNEEHVGADDSRLVDPSNKIKGLGKGTIRVYSDSNGELVGWARTFKNTNKFFSYSPQFPSDTKARKAAVGRPIAGN